MGGWVICIRCRKVGFHISGPPPTFSQPVSKTFVSDSVTAQNLEIFAWVNATFVKVIFMISKNIF